MTLIEPIGRTAVRSTLLLPLVLLGVTAPLSQSYGQSSNITVKFVARQAQLNIKARPAIVGELPFAPEPPPDPQGAAGAHDLTFTGHAFMIITVHTSIGPKEEIYGFYPRNGGTGMIKGPGMLRSEFRCTPNDDCDPARHNQLKRLSESTETVEIPITAAQRSQIYRTVAIWNDANYDLLGKNCTHFVSDVVSMLGLKAPTWRDGMLPVTYIKSLRANISDELARREEVERERIRAEQARRNREEEHKRQEAAAVEAARIPKDWVECTCPDRHKNVGKWGNGHFSHVPGLSCQ